jgi:hypothetical protein
MPGGVLAAREQWRQHSWCTGWTENDTLVVRLVTSDTLAGQYFASRFWQR